MEFSRTSQRRRRVAMDQKASEPAEADATSAAAPRRTDRAPRGAGRFAAGARRNRQLRTTDLIPKRPWSVACLLMALASCCLALNLLHAAAGNLRASLGHASFSLLSMDSQRGLAFWFTSCCLLLVCFACLQVYLLRRHRCDDYRGSYRIWMWLAALSVLGSLSCTTDFGLLSRDLASEWFGHTAGLWVGLVAAALIVTLALARGIYEVRSSLGASIAWGLSLVFYLVAIGSSSESVNAALSTIIPSPSSNGLLMGTSSLLAGVLLFARFVYLQAHGVLARVSRKKRLESIVSPPRRVSGKSSNENATVKQKSSTKSPAARKSGSSKTRDPKTGESADAAPAKPRSERKSKRSKWTSIDSLEDVEPRSSSAERSESKGMSKSDRRRERKLKKRQRQAA